MFIVFRDCCLGKCVRCKGIKEKVRVMKVETFSEVKARECLKYYEDYNSEIFEVKGGEIKRLMQWTDEDKIGYLVNVKNHNYPQIKDNETHQEFWCRDCGEPCDKELSEVEKDLDEYTPVYYINVRPYSQSCDCCGRVVVDGVRTNGVACCLFGLQS